MANRRFIDFPIASTSGDTDIILIWQGGANKQTTKATFLSGLPENLDELNDVAISGLTNGQILRYDSVTGKWENTDQGNLDLNDLNDVSIVSPSNGQVLVYNSSTSKWENSSGGFVPYVGAVTTVDLGAQGLRAGYVRFDTTVAGVPNEQGLMFWDADDETVDIILNGYTMKIGEDLFYPVKNQTGSTIAKGVAVRFNGTVGNSGRLLIAPFIADGSVPSSRFMGVTAEEILNGEDGKVLYFGRVRGINTNAFNEGDILYASTTIAGGYQTAIPVAPNNIVQVAAVVTKSATVGTIFVRPTLGSNINKDEGVKIVSVADKNLLQYQSGTSLWENKSLAQVLGGTSAQFVKGDGSLDSNTYGTGTVTSVGLSSATSGVTIGSTPVTTSGTITLAIATASGSQNGLLSSTDWTTFNSKQNALTNPVTGTGVSGRVAYWNGTNSITSDADLLFDGSNLTVGGNVFVGSSQIIGINTVDGADNGYLAICGASADGSDRAGHIYLSGNERGADAGSVVIAGGNTTSGTGATAAIVFRTLGTNKARLTSAGNFGLGTETPVTFGTRNLDVNGGAGSAYIVARGLNNAGTVEMAFDGGGYIGTKTAHDLVIRTNDVQRINVFATSGNVLVGGSGSDNGARLQVSGTARFDVNSQNVILTLNNPDNTKSPALTFAIGGSTRSIIQVNNSNSNLNFLVNGGDTTALSLNGTTGAATFSSSVTANQISSIVTSGTARVTIGDNLISGGSLLNLSGVSGGKTWFIANNYNVGGALEFIQSTTNGGTTPASSGAMLITSSGNVLIGTTTDGGRKLEVQTNSTNAGLWVQTGGTTSAFTIADFRTGTNLPALQILGNGNSIFNAKVLVNESGVSPQGEQFAVTATNLAAMFKTTGGAANNWAANFWNNATSGNNLFIEFGTETSYNGRGSVTYNRGSGVVAYNTTSDYRIKTEIQDFNAFNIINNIKPKEFRIGDAKQKSIGFIAHELQEFFPQAVHGEKDAIDSNNKPIYQGVDYSQLTGLLVKAIQELKQEIDTLKN